MRLSIKENDFNLKKDARSRRFLVCTFTHAFNMDDIALFFWSGEGSKSNPPLLNMELAAKGMVFFEKSEITEN